jgi:ABC-type nickel/cobalt efflux system permease component RcnA
VDNCIGRDNYVPFMAFVGALVVDLIAMEVVLFRAWQLTHGLHMWWLPLCAVYIASLLVPVAYLFGFHVYLSARNLTTNEVINAHRYQHQGRQGHSHGQDRGHGHSHQHGKCDGNHERSENPFDRGLMNNLAERCLPTCVTSESGGEAKQSLLPTGRKRKDPGLMV